MDDKKLKIMALKIAQLLGRSNSIPPVTSTRNASIDYMASKIDQLLGGSNWSAPAASTDSLFPPNYRFLPSHPAEQLAELASTKALPSDLRPIDLAKLLDRTSFRPAYSWELGSNSTSRKIAPPEVREVLPFKLPAGPLHVALGLAPPPAPAHPQAGRRGGQVPASATVRHLRAVKARMARPDRPQPSWGNQYRVLPGIGRTGV